jgi:hypothetical protein
VVLDSKVRKAFFWVPCSSFCSNMFVGLCLLLKGSLYRSVRSERLHRVLRADKIHTTNIGRATSGCLIKTGGDIPVSSAGGSPSSDLCLPCPLQKALATQNLFPCSKKGQLSVLFHPVPRSFHIKMYTL